MTRFLLQRTARSLITLWIVVTAVFFVLRLTGDPAEAALGPDASEPALEAYRAAHHLDAPAPVQYLSYLRDLATGDLGESMKYDRPVLELFRQRIPATLELGGTALLIAIILGVPAGILAAMRHNTAIDRVTMFFAFVAHAAPGFFIGILLILFLSFRWHLVPSSGHGGIRHLIMPALTLATGLLASLARMTRSSLLEVRGAEYIRTARAKGVAPARIITGHMLRNAALPVMTMLGMWIAGIIGGAAVTETIFAWPGVGRLVVDAVSQRDFPVVQSLVLLVAVSVVVVNLLVDIAYGWLDPRISLTAGAR